MASKSLGTLTLDLVARVGGFVSGMDRAERASEDWRRQVQEDAKATTVALAGIATAAVAVGTAIGVAGFNLLKSSAEQVAATDQWAKALKVSTQELLAWQFAAERAGIAGDNIADIFKDVSDKIGDATLNKSGDAVDALDALGLSAEKLSKTTPDKQILAIGSALSKISSNSEKVTILESFGNDLTKFIPLFDNNNEKLQKFISLAKDYGVAPDPKDIDDLVKVNDLFMDMEGQVSGLKMQIAGGLAKVDLSPLQNSLEDVRKILTDPTVLQGIVNLVSQVAELAGWLVKSAAAAGKLAANSTNRMAALSGKIDTSNADQVQQRIEWLEKNKSGRSDGMYGQSQSMFGWLSGKDDSIKAVNDELSNLYEQREKLIKQKPLDIPSTVTPVTASGLLDFSLPTGGTNGKVTPDAGAKKLESAFKATELSYQRQIALIDTTGKKTAEVTEAQKLQFDLADGKLAGINAAQRTRLEGLAAEVDRLNDVKKANIEMAKVAEFTANLNAGNQNARQDLNVDVQGAGLGDKDRGRMKERLSIERSFLDQQRQLQLSYQSGDITKSLYDQETGALNSAMSERLSIQEDYYKSMDAMQSDWVGGVSDGLANWLDESSDYASQAAGVMGTAMDGIVGNINTMLDGSKASWKDWGLSVLKTIQNVLVNAAAVKSVQALMGIGTSLVGAAAGSGAAAGASSNNAFAGGSYSGLTLNAKGGVYSSHDLSAYSGQIVNSPTMFAFAKGAGLMGEAGPEAIMPLTRASDGSLGVRALSGGQSPTGTGGEAPKVYITIDGNGNSNTQASSGYEQFGSEIGRMVEQKYVEMRNRDLRPGGALFRNMKGR